MRHIAWLLALAAPLGAQSLEAELRARISGFPGTVSLYAKNLDTGTAVGIAESVPVRTPAPSAAGHGAVIRRGAPRQTQWTKPLTCRKADH